MADIPDWLNKFVVAEFHTECPKPHHHRSTWHDNRMKSFCISCSQGPFCDKDCTSYHSDPAEHTLLEVSKQGEDSVVQAKDVRNLLKLDGIKQYVHGGSNVVLIRARLQGVRATLEDLPDVQVPWECVVCGTPFRDEFRYCSLECMMASILNPDHPDCPTRNFLDRVGTDQGD